jgi:single-stranded DNA-binding protein
MGDTNYLGSIVKILEKPIQTIVNDKVLKTECRAQLAQVRNTRIINLVFWGNLANDSVNSYQVNDYIMIEGYVSVREMKSKKLMKSNLKKIQIAVLKSFPLK